MSSSRIAVLLLLAASLAACGGNGDGNAGDRNQPPVARLTLSPTSGTAPLTIAGSSAGSSDADGTITGYAWDFGDGSGATGAQVEHTYSTVGEFVVTLTVTDDEGATGAASASAVATGSSAVYNGSLFDAATYLDAPSSGTLDATPLQ
jgi:PKD repeat protein